MILVSNYAGLIEPTECACDCLLLLDPAPSNWLWFIERFGMTHIDLFSLIKEEVNKLCKI